MVAYQHPSELNPLQLYRQASAILRGTSRATNDAWYQSPLELEFQLHLRLDGSRFDSRIHQPATGLWTPGPGFDEELLLDPSRISAFAAEAVALAKKAGAKSLGVVVHNAEEFATTEINPELDNPGALGELRETIATDPKAVLDDSSLSPDEHVWRLVPYASTVSESIATAVTLSRRLDDFVSALRDYGVAQNFPVATLSVSAPLLGLLALAQVRTKAPERTSIAVLPYNRFTVLAFFNEHGDLQLLRTLQHRGQRRPNNLRHAASTTAAALEMAAPDITVLPLAGEPDPQLISDLRVVFDESDIQQADWDSSLHRSDATRDVAPEMLIATSLAKPLETPLAKNHTFTTLRTEGWAVQDFLPRPASVTEIYPSRGEMKLLRAAKYSRFGLVALVLLAAAWVGLSLLDMVRQPQWSFRTSDAQNLTNRLSTLGKERQRIQHWDNLLEDRSKAWVSLELLSRMFPEKSGFLVRSFRHNASPENVPGQTQVGFVKEWRINGLAREEALERLADLNTREGISAVFSDLAKLTGNQAFAADLPSRSLVVSVRTQENSGFKPVPPEQASLTDESSYPYLFDLTITQRFEAADPMALNTSKAP